MAFFEYGTTRYPPATGCGSPPQHIPRQSSGTHIPPPASYRSSRIGPSMSILLRLGRSGPMASRSKPTQASNRSIQFRYNTPASNLFTPPRTSASPRRKASACSRRRATGSEYPSPHRRNLPCVLRDRPFPGIRAPERRLQSHRIPSREEYRPNAVRRSSKYDSQARPHASLQAGDNTSPYRSYRPVRTPSEPG